MSNMSDQDFVENLYRVILDREPDRDELEECLSCIQETLDYKYPFLKIYLSSEFKDRKTQSLTINNEYNFSDYTRSNVARNPDLHERVRKFFARLMPMDVLGYEKIRVGRDFDGGYIMIDDFVDIRAAYSLGISDDVSWDLQIAERGIVVHQYDGTIDDLPQFHPKFNWNKSNISTHVDNNINTISLQAALDANNDQVSYDYILKMDIEGDEWELLAQIDTVLLKSFRQIICEVHDLNRISEDERMNLMNRAVHKLTKFHNVVHVHANNGSPLVVVGGVAFPNVIELTLIRKADANFTLGRGILPSHIDKTNSPQWADYFLGCFKFL